MPAVQSTFSAAEPGSDELLHAASVAAHETFWPDSETSGPCRRTQGRRLETAERATGLVADSGQAPRILGVPELTLCDKAKERAAGWKARGAAVLAVLASIIVQPQGWQQILACGAAAGAWGEPLLWDSARSHLESLTFGFGVTEEADRGATAFRGSRVLPAGLLAFAREQTAADPASSLPEIIRRARGAGIISRSERIDRATLWRACQRTDVPTSRRKRQKLRDARRFAYR